MNAHQLFHDNTRQNTTCHNVIISFHYTLNLCILCMSSVFKWRKIQHFYLITSATVKPYVWEFHSAVTHIPQYGLYWSVRCLWPLWFRFSVCFFWGIFPNAATRPTLEVKQWHNRPRTQAPLMLVHRYVDENGLAAMLATKRSAGVTPEVNLRILLCADDKTHKWGDLPWLWNQGQTSPRDQNMSISGSTKMTDVLQIF